MRIAVILASNMGVFTNMGRAWWIGLLVCGGVQGCSAAAESGSGTDGWRVLTQVDCPEPLNNSDLELGRLLGAREQAKGACLLETHPRRGQRFRLEFRNAVLTQQLRESCYRFDEEAVTRDAKVYIGRSHEAVDGMKNQMDSYYQDTIRHIVATENLCTGVPAFRRTMVKYQPRLHKASFFLVWYLGGLKFTSRTECGRAIPSGATGCDEYSLLPVVVVPRGMLRTTVPGRSQVESVWPPSGDTLSQAKIEQAAGFDIQDEVFLEEAIQRIASGQGRWQAIGDSWRVFFEDGSSVVSKTRANGAERFDALFYELDKLLGFGLVPATHHVVDEQGGGRAIMIDVPGTSISPSGAVGTIREYNRYLAAAHTVQGWKAAIFHYLIHSSHGYVRNSVVLDDGRIALFDLFASKLEVIENIMPLPGSFFYSQLSWRSRFPSEVSDYVADALRRSDDLLEPIIGIMEALYPERDRAYAVFRTRLMFESLKLLYELQRLPSAQETIFLPARSR